MSRPGLRIVGGTLRGRRLETPPAIRPTGSKVREALFAIWDDRVVGARFLDLFAGSGAVGLEAVSGGAAWATFLESSPRVLPVLKRNCYHLAAERTEVLRIRLPAGLRRPLDGPYGLLFADPPYRFRAYRELLESATAWATPGAAFAIEHSARQELPRAVEGWLAAAERRYGESCLAFYERA